MHKYFLPITFSRSWLGALLGGLLLADASFAAMPSAAPKVGETAPNFTLTTLDNRSVELKPLTATTRVVLVVLRGWPGYQCPLCTRQVQDFVAHAREFAERNVQVVMVYPGPAEQLKAHAGEFLQDKQWPANFLFVIDPDYTFTTAYGLRWEAKKETAYPSTFVIERGGVIGFAHISDSHGNRLSAQRTLEQLK
jgi:thioredoxin-dependent peroxiredoxin